MAAGAFPAAVKPASRTSAVMARVWLVSMVLVALWVQVAVWGVPRAHSDAGAALGDLRHLFGPAYAAVLLAGELAFCAAYRTRLGAVWVLSTCAGVDLIFWTAHLAGVRFALAAAAALTAGSGAVVLAAVVQLVSPEARPFRYLPER